MTDDSFLKRCDTEIGVLSITKLCKLKRLLIPKKNTVTNGRGKAASGAVFLSLKHIKGRGRSPHG
ncbi:hypothetical protein [Aerosakkonema sp. BLCC-F183]|uniref:hypothetical protein n=1 Tax=Aerosakkonema sp. BLCC-F183 TaxID=3342834 RepID=UPI0035BBCCB9